jgi:hypothetical protein
MKDDLNEVTVLKKKILELRNSLLLNKVETLQKTIDISNSKNDNSEETTTVRLKCRQCDETFLSYEKFELKPCIKD